MREILFRAKRKDNGAWETGSLVFERMGTSEERVYIADKMTAYHTPVFPETVGEFTGLTDKNGVRIFEGDIVTYPVGIRNYKGEVIFWCAAFCIEHFFPKNLITTLDDDAADCEVIGNIYDNPELGGENDD